MKTTSTADLIARLTDIVQIQSGIIDDLFTLLLQYEAVDSIDQKIYDAMQQAAEETKTCLKTYCL